MNTIIADPESFNDTVKFLKKYFDNVKVIKNKHSYLAKKAQGYFIIILFTNRGIKFSIKWQGYYPELHFGDVTKNKTTCLKFSFTKMKYDNCYPIEIDNNSNIMFWTYEIVEPHETTGSALNPLRLPITIKKISIN